LEEGLNRQNSIELDGANDGLKIEWHKRQRDVIDLAKSAYQWAIENGIAKEQARAVLPEGNTVSRLYMNGSLRSWIHYIQLRSGNGTQKEHLEIAKKCAEVIATVFPMANEFVVK
jgi:thymidylate synthase (FAD)